jgi:hypothetical protein
VKLCHIYPQIYSRSEEKPHGFSPTRHNKHFKYRPTLLSVAVDSHLIYRLVIVSCTTNKNRTLIHKNQKKAIRIETGKRFNKQITLTLPCSVAMCPKFRSKSSKGSTKKMFTGRVKGPKTGVNEQRKIFKRSSLFLSFRWPENNFGTWQHCPHESSPLKGSRE